MEIPFLRKKEEPLPELARGLLPDVQPEEMHPGPETKHEEKIQAFVPIYSEDQRIGFFSNLQARLRNEHGQDALLSRDLLAEMKSFWKYERPSLAAMGRLEAELREKMESLQQLEEQWQFIQEQIEEQKKSADEKEKEIEAAAKELQGSLRRITFYQNVSPENYFHLANGRIIRSPAELLAALKEMPDELFSQHVNSERNDFASWIEGVLKDSKLAAGMRSSQKSGEIQLLEGI